MKKLVKKVIHLTLIPQEDVILNQITLVMSGVIWVTSGMHMQCKPRDATIGSDV